HCFQIITCGHEIEAPFGLRDTALRLKGDLWVCVATLLGGDHHHAIRCSRPVDACGCGGFEDLDRFDIVGIEPCHISLHSIDEDYGVIRLVDRRATPYQEARICTRLDVCCGHAYAPQLTFQGIADGVDDCTFHL